MVEPTTDTLLQEGTHMYPNVHGIHTHVIKYGELDSRKSVVLVIPGNPGAIDFYDKFMECLHKHSRWPVWGLSHAGHSIVPEHAGWREPNSSVFTVEGQIQHKVQFINEFIPEDVEIVLIGHSVGAHVILEIMERISSKRVKQGMLLFPTLEKMAESPQGKRLTPILKYGRWFLVFLSALLWLLPSTWKARMISHVFAKRRRFMRAPVPHCINQGAFSVINPYCLWNACYMAYMEMKEIVDLNVKVLQRQIDKLRFYYGATDHWAPMHHYYRMKALFPDHPNIELCTSGIRHAFIIDASESMADKVSQWLSLL